VSSSVVPYKQSLVSLGLQSPDARGSPAQKLKEAVIAFSVNIAAAVFFLFSGQVVWLAALVMAVGALVGGALVGKVAGRIRPSTLRAIAVVIGVVVAAIYCVR
jgi:uncharacterized membrane protein YfcA